MSLSKTEKANDFNKQNVYLNNSTTTDFNLNTNVFAKRDINKDDVVLIGVPQYQLNKNTTHSLYLDWGQCVIFQEEIIMIAHSCCPNLKIKNNEHNGYTWYAALDIKQDEMLSWNYTTIENNIV